MTTTKVQDPTIAHPDYIADLIHESYAGPAWHGPCVVEALAGVDETAATARVSPHRHSIWELVLHLAHGRHLLIERIKNEAEPPFPRAIKEPWWPVSPADFTATAWLMDRDLLEDYQERLLAAIRSATPEQLARVPDRSEMSVARQLVGMALHDTYHAGQIKLIALSAGV